MKKVKFTQMKDGTKEDYLLLDKHEKEFVKKTPDRILNYMSKLTSALEGYKCTNISDGFLGNNENIGWKNSGLPCK